jgi:serine/threonine-protein kinase RsbW
VNQPDAELRLPAESAYVAVLRMTTVGLAARLDFTLDDIEDVRMAVGEACALVLEGATPHGRLHAAYGLSEGTLTITVSADSVEAGGPDQDSFAWQVLSALVDDLRAESPDGKRVISFTVTSETA